MLQDVARPVTAPDGDGALSPTAGVETSFLRDPAVLLHSLTGSDEVHTFYHDETNNVRRFRFTATGFNVADPQPARWCS